MVQAAVSEPRIPRIYPWGVSIKTHLKNIYLMTKPGEKKSNFAKTVMDMDQLTMTILKEHNGLNRKSDGLLLKPGKQISEEIHTLNTDSAFQHQITSYCTDKFCSMSVY